MDNKLQSPIHERPSSASVAGNHQPDDVTNFDAQSDTTLGALTFFESLNELSNVSSYEYASYYALNAPSQFEAHDFWASGGVVQTEFDDVHQGNCQSRCDGVVDGTVGLMSEHQQYMGHQDEEKLPNMEHALLNFLHEDVPDYQASTPYAMDVEPVIALPSNRCKYDKPGREEPTNKYQLVQLPGSVASFITSQAANPPAQAQPDTKLQAPYPARTKPARASSTFPWALQEITRGIEKKPTADIIQAATDLKTQITEWHDERDRLEFAMMKKKQEHKARSGTSELACPEERKARKQLADRIRGFEAKFVKVKAELEKRGVMLKD